jgi:hypothetical protein
MENYQNSDRRMILLTDLFIVVMAILCAWLIFLTFTGYGTVKLNLPTNVTTRVNGHIVTAHSLKMRPGNYQIIVSSPTITPYQGTLQVGLFQTINYSLRLTQRSADAIAGSVIGGDGQTGNIQLGLVEWFNNNSWVVGLVSPGDTDLALHYNSTQNQWVVGYYNASGYTADLTALPANVANYIEQLEAQHVQG